MNNEPSNNNFSQIKNADEQTVKPHKQRYGKDKIWKEKESYKRNKKD